MSGARVVAVVVALVVLQHTQVADSCLCLLIRNYKCPEPPSCCESGQYTLDECGCCQKCAKAELQTCGGASQVSGKCAGGLQCLKTCLPCKTVGERGLPCIFPFKYEDPYGNWTYNTCTTKDSEDGQPWCATEVDSQGYVVDHAWGDCLDGCPGTRVECDEEYFSIQEGKCIDVSVPGSIPNWFGAPAVKLEDPEADLFPAPLCSRAAVRLYDNTCRCDRGPTAVDYDLEGTPRGNCTGLEDDTTDNLDKVWCFLENIRDPRTPRAGCYSDTLWSERDGRYWSSLACTQAPDIENSGPRLLASQTSPSQVHPPFSQDRVPSSQKKSSKQEEQPASQLEELPRTRVVVDDEELEDIFSDVESSTLDPTRFLFIPDVKESRSSRPGIINSILEERSTQPSKPRRKTTERAVFEPSSSGGNGGISFSEGGDNNLFDVLSQLDL